MDVADWSDRPVDEVYPGITRQILQGERQTLVRYVYAPGSVFPVHSHPQEQITAVISGEIEFVIEGEPIVLRGGQAAVIPANMPHGARVVGASVVETFNALSPRRDDQPAPARETGS
jgi:quercetin dioxygenase-like cupin family protein